MSSPVRCSPSSPVGSSRNQVTNGSFKLVISGTLILITCASLYVAVGVTGNFSNIPEIPHADIPSETRDLVEKDKSPWKIRERKPFRINPMRLFPLFDETNQQVDSKEAVKSEKKATQKEVKNETLKEEVKVEEKPEQKEVKKETLSEKSDHKLHIPATKHNVTATKILESQQRSGKVPSVTDKGREKVKQQVKEAKKESTRKQPEIKTPKLETNETTGVKQENAPRPKTNETATINEEKAPRPTTNETASVKQEKAPNLATNETASTKQETVSKKKHKPLNILLLFADDMRHDSIGVASNGLVKTPFLDNLATQGVRFTHNCVTTSVCWVSRATLYSGQYVSRHKSTEPTKPEFLRGWNQTFPYLLKKAGYYFGHVGKWHFKDYHVVKPTFDWERSYYGRHWFQERDGPIHTTKKNENDAIDFLRERPKDKPFCLTVCFFTPHAHDGEPEQYLPQNESMALYLNDTIPLAPSATDEAWKKMPHFFGDKNEGRNRYFWRFDTPEKHQRMMKNYYRLISEIDSTSGKIVKELEDQGVLDDTLIIFTTDNGYFHAEHGLADKFYPYQESIRVPLIVRDPRMAKSRIGKLNDEFTLNIDLAPTILGAAGLPTPDVMHGRDFAPLYTEEKQDSSWRNEFFYEHPVHLREDIIPASEALVRKDYKYLYWPNYNVEQLFDLRNDTYELNDLIRSDGHKELLGEMRSRFRELKEKAK